VAWFVNTTAFGCKESGEVTKKNPRQQTFSRNYDLEMPKHEAEMSTV